MIAAAARGFFSPLAVRSSASGRRLVSLSEQGGAFFRGLAVVVISSKISIDIDSAAFHALQEKFDKYKEALDKTSAAWRRAGYVQP